MKDTVSMVFTGKFGFDSEYSITVEISNNYYQTLIVAGIIEQVRDTLSSPKKLNELVEKTWRDRNPTGIRE